MNKPNGYDAVQPISYSRNYPIPGPYVLGIYGVDLRLSSNNNEMLVLTLDIIEGEYAHFYRELGRELGKDCLLKHYRLTNSDAAVPYLKGDIQAIEKSNPGYSWMFDEKTLRGKKVGGMLQEEEYFRNDGNIGTILKIMFLCSIETVKSGKLKIPEKKCIDRMYAQPSQSNANNQQNIQIPYNNDLPF